MNSTKKLILLLAMLGLVYANGDDWERKKSPPTVPKEKQQQRMEQADENPVGGEQGGETNEEKRLKDKRQYEEKKLKWLMEHEARYPHNY